MLLSTLDMDRLSYSFWMASEAPERNYERVLSLFLSELYHSVSAIPFLQLDLSFSTLSPYDAPPSPPLGNAVREFQNDFYVFFSAFRGAR